MPKEKGHRSTLGIRAQQPARWASTSSPRGLPVDIEPGSSSRCCNRGVLLTPVYTEEFLL